MKSMLSNWEQFKKKKKKEKQKAAEKAAEKQLLRFTRL